MTLTLDAATEKRIQQEIDLGHYTDVAVVVAHADSASYTAIANEAPGRRDP